MKMKQVVLLLMMVALIFVGVVVVTYSAHAACTTDVPARCHNASTNQEGISQRRTSDGFDIQCITVATNGSYDCISTTNNCIFEEWLWLPLFGDGPHNKVTNTWETTKAANPGCIGG